MTSRAAGSRDAPRLRVGVISAGRVGSVLGAAWSRAGHRVVGVSGVSDASRRRAEELLPDVAVLGPDEVAAAADLVLLAVPDDVLGGVVRGLVAMDALRPGQIVVHTSGAHGIDILAPATEVGVLPLALHPAMTFTGRAEDVERLASACTAVTGPSDEASWSVGAALALEWGTEPVWVPESARKLYHAALTHGANHLMTLVNECSDLLAGAGVEGPQRLMAPVLSASLDNALRYGDPAVTGPVVRGDAGTVRAHVAALEAADPAVVPAYVELARRTAQRAVDAGVLSVDAASAVHAVLDEER